MSVRSCESECKGRNPKENGRCCIVLLVAAVVVALVVAGTNEWKAGRSALFIDDPAISTGTRRQTRPPMLTRIQTPKQISIHRHIIDLPAVFIPLVESCRVVVTGERDEVRGGKASRRCGSGCFKFMQISSAISATASFCHQSSAGRPVGRSLDAYLNGSSQPDYYPRPSPDLEIAAELGGKETSTEKLIDVGPVSLIVGLPPSLFCSPGFAFSSRRPSLASLERRMAAAFARWQQQRRASQ